MSDGSSDKHTGNERERLLDSTSLPLMGSGLTLLMRKKKRVGVREKRDLIGPVCCISAAPCSSRGVWSRKGWGMGCQSCLKQNSRVVTELK